MFKSDLTLILFLSLWHMTHMTWMSSSRWQFKNNDVFVFPWFPCQWHSCGFSTGFMCVKHVERVPLLICMTGRNIGFLQIYILKYQLILNKYVRWSNALLDEYDQYQTKCPAHMLTYSSQPTVKHWLLSQGEPSASQTAWRSDSTQIYGGSTLCQSVFWDSERLFMRTPIKKIVRRCFQATHSDNIILTW